MLQKFVATLLLDDKALEFLRFLELVVLIEKKHKRRFLELVILLFFEQNVVVFPLLRDGNSDLNAKANHISNFEKE